MSLLADTIVHWYRNPQWYQVIASLLLAFIAIFGREKFFRLKFSYELSKINQNVAGGSLVQYWRIKVRNAGRRKANEVIAEVTKIYDYKKGKYREREDFIHMPLRWTHYDNEQRRTVAINEDALVDLGTYDILDPKLFLATYPQTFTSNLQEIDNNAKIVIKVSEASGFFEEITLIFKMTTSGADIRII